MVCIFYDMVCCVIVSYDILCYVVVYYDMLCYVVERFNSLNTLRTYPLMNLIVIKSNATYYSNGIKFLFIFIFRHLFIMASSICVALVNNCGLL